MSLISNTEKLQTILNSNNKVEWEWIPITSLPQPLIEAPIDDPIVFYLEIPENTLGAIIKRQSPDNEIYNLYACIIVNSEGADYKSYHYSTFPSDGLMNISVVEDSVFSLTCDKTFLEQFYYGFIYL